MPRRFPRRELTRIAAPLAFLAAVTILVLLVHSALSGGSGDSTKTVTHKKPTKHHTTTRNVTTTAPTTTRKHSTGPPKKYYVIVSGDTFSVIAAREGTTVEKLIALNPGVDSSALSIGQKIRVG